MSPAIEPLKILVCGDVEGNFNQLFTRVSSVNKKNGPFEMLFCVGNFFGEDNSEWNSYLSEEKTVPITTYILGPCSEEYVPYYKSTGGSDLCPNVTYLGKKGLLTGSSGLKVAYLSGKEAKNDNRSDWEFTAADVLAIQEPLIEAGGFRGIDILLTSQWPKNVTRFSGVPDDLSNENYGSELVSQLALMLKPRYHFSGLEGVHYERLPYRNHKVLAEKTKHVTRFISLANVKNVKKKKWLYAFGISPIAQMSHAELTKQPTDVTECPYTFKILKTEQQKKDDRSVQFFYDLESKPSRKDHKKRHGKEQGERQPKQPRQNAQPQDPCWFCLSSPKVEKHLVVSVGETVYLALAKGSLHQYHALILPIEHHKSTVDLDPDVLEEVEKFKLALKSFYKDEHMVPVFYERNFKSTHLQIQVIPVPEKVASRVKEVFLDHAACQSIDLTEIPKHSDLKQIVNSGVPYFYVELDNKEKLFHRVQKGGFPIQFGREVLVSGPLLNMPGKADWRSCSKTQEEESKLCQDFRKAFQPFDFTLL